MFVFGDVGRNYAFTYSVNVGPFFFLNIPPSFGASKVAFVKFEPEVKLELFDAV